MIDTDKYEGHTEGLWWADEWFSDDVVQFERGYCVEQRIVNESPVVDHSGKWVCLVDNEADAKLIADAPLLLAEVMRLRGLLDEIDDVVYYNDKKAGQVLPVEKPNLELLRDIMMSYTDEAYQIRGDEGGWIE
jgi:hypothetical protein